MWSQKCLTPPKGTTSNDYKQDSAGIMYHYISVAERRNDDNYADERFKAFDILPRQQDSCEETHKKPSWFKRVKKFASKRWTRFIRNVRKTATRGRVSPL